MRQHRERFEIGTGFCPNGCHPVALYDSGHLLGWANPSNGQEVLWAFMTWFRSTPLTWRRAIELMSQAMEAVHAYNAALPPRTVLVYAEYAPGRYTTQRVEVQR